MTHQVLLLFPPVWLPDAPYLSLPTLKAFLKENNIGVSQRDLNIEFWNYLYQPESILKIHKRLRDFWKSFSTDKKPEENDGGLLKKVSILRKISQKQFITEIREGIIDRDTYLELIKSFSEFSCRNFQQQGKKRTSDNNSPNYHDLLFEEISLSSFAESSEDLKKIVQAGNNPFTIFYKKHIINSIIEKNPGIVGISIAALNQVVPAFTLAFLLKRQLSATKIVLGGPWCSLVQHEFKEVLNKFDFIDFMIVHEGEHSFRDLIDAIYNNSQVKHVPNLYYKDSSNTCFTYYQDGVDLDTLPTPDFSDLPLDLYFSVKTLPVQASRGCYWAKCIFCSYPLLEKKFKQRSVDLIVNDIINLQEQFATQVFSFSDAVMSPHFARSFSEELIKRKLTLNWIALARFEPTFSRELLRQMRKSGCAEICWGLESGNARVLKEINKNISLEDATNILSYSSVEGIQNRVLVMYDLPSETIEEAYETILFIKKNIKYINTLSFSLYYPEKNTPIENYFQRYLNKINSLNEQNNDISFKYENFRNLKMCDITKINNEYFNLDRQIIQNQFMENELIQQFVNFKNRHERLSSIIHINQYTKKISSRLLNYQNFSKRYFFETP